MSGSMSVVVSVGRSGSPGSLSFLILILPPSLPRWCSLFLLHLLRVLRDALLFLFYTFFLSLSGDDVVWLAVLLYAVSVHKARAACRATRRVIVVHLCYDCDENEMYSDDCIVT